MKFISKILYLIIGLLVAICALIIACEVQPGLSKTINALLDEYVISRLATPEEEAAADGEGTAPATTDISLTELSITDNPEQQQQNEEPMEDEQETAHSYNYDVTYVELVKNWDDSVIDVQNLSNNDYKDFVNTFLNPDEDKEYQRTVPEDSSRLLLPQPEIVNVENDYLANEIKDIIDEGAAGDSFEFDPLYYPYYQMLNDRGQALYRQIYANTLALNKKFAPVLEDATDKEVESAFMCVLCDHPELFWLDGTYYFQYDYKGHVLELDLAFYSNFDDMTYAMAEFEETAKSLVAPAANLGSDYEKELYVHNLLVDKLSYQFNSLDQTAYSGVVRDYTVCAGYTRAFQYMMQLLKVPTYFCYGWGGGGSHAWNIVLLEDGYHNVDCTWDDSLSGYDYFNLSDLENDGHWRMNYAAYLPKCTESQYKPGAAAMLAEGQ